MNLRRSDPDIALAVDAGWRCGSIIDYVEDLNLFGGGRLTIQSKFTKASKLL